MIISEKQVMQLLAIKLDDYISELTQKRNDNAV